MKISSSKIIEINNLTISYKYNQKPILNDLSLHINKGDNLAIIGPSGCGKSTFAKSIVHMLPNGTNIEGEILINGLDPGKFNKEELQTFRRSVFGFIYQDSIKKLNPLMTVGDHLFELLKIHWPNRSNISIEKMVKSTFNKVGISKYRLNSYPHEFSGGMRQRVCIALALALHPLLLIADEPTTSLDTYTSFEVMNQLLYLCKEFGSTLILISHDINLASAWCKKIAIMNNGYFEEYGDIKKILNRPNSNIGKKLVDSINLDLKPNKTFKNTEEVILEAINLRYWYKLNSSFLWPKWNKALNEVSFKLYKNETLGLVGMSGSGKSTLCRALIGLLKIRGGNINFSRRNIDHNKRFRNAKIIQVIFQDPFSTLNPKMTIKKILEDVYFIHNIFKKTEMNFEIKSFLKKVNLPVSDDFLNAYPCQLSGGQLQRISIVKALIVKPQILICDESVNMLDAAIKKEILYLLRKIQNNMNLSIIFITHDLGLAKIFCDRLLVMNNGKIVEEGYPKNIFENPKHLTTKKLLKSSLNIS
ncbi:MAG: ABC transporter ATP-binding protein [Prochlorococcus sp. SP3034]|nr:ABC transporter ATP-binding protein [Prochlorococcus sp. SP3034]|tara:strand:+ start:10316 stop:11908 length:1593 start_codon:yes stop_codon:yes gene_type:complete